MRLHIVLLIATSLLVAACSDDQATDSTVVSSTSLTMPDTTDQSTTAVSTTDSATTDSPTTVPKDSFADRPFDVFVPSAYDAATPAPLVILLHGYGASGNLQELYFKLQPQAEAHGFLYVHPDGLINGLDSQYWNATEACCDATRTIDDSSYLTSIIDSVSATYNVDQSRVYVVGHSNGGFMSYRMACEHADRIAAIVSLAGATFLDAAECAPSEPVNVLQIHGDLDGTIQYEGGSTVLGPFPSAATTVATWAAYNGCGTTTESLGDIDIDGTISGAETSEQRFIDCPTDGDVELWTIAGGAHIPSLAPTFAADIFDWLLVHPNS